MNVLIVEDERPAAERLERALGEYSGGINVLAHLQTVEDTVRWFRQHPDPDLMFLDVQLSDGLSLELFRHVQVTCPVVFTTAYDAYVLDAFECNSIDYLLKPVRQERLTQALQKYEKLRRHFGGDVADLLRRASPKKAYKRRLLVQKGTSYVAIDTSAVRYAFSEEKLTFVVDVDGRRYLCEDALTALEEQLDPAEFFRLNRKYVARIEAVGSFKPGSRGRIAVNLNPAAGEEIIVSQEKAGRFREWIAR